MVSVNLKWIYVSKEAHAGSGYAFNIYKLRRLKIQTWYVDNDAE